MTGRKGTPKVERWEMFCGEKGMNSFLMLDTSGQGLEVQLPYSLLHISFVF